MRCLRHIVIETVTASTIASQTRARCVQSPPPRAEVHVQADEIEAIASDEISRALHRRARSHACCARRQLALSLPFRVSVIHPEHRAAHPLASAFVGALQSEGSWNAIAARDGDSRFSSNGDACITARSAFSRAAASASAALPGHASRCIITCTPIAGACRARRAVAPFWRRQTT
jgi:hypothetical protein